MIWDGGREDWERPVNDRTLARIMIAFCVVLVLLGAVA
jgi:hypothetical protein